MRGAQGPAIQSDRCELAPAGEYAPHSAMKRTSYHEGWKITAIPVPYPGLHGQWAGNKYVIEDSRGHTEQVRHELGDPLDSVGDAIRSCLRLARENIERRNRQSPQTDESG